MDMLLLTKGATYWQLLFIKNAGDEVGQYEVSNILKMLITLPELFPEEDYSPLFKQFEKEFTKRAEKSAQTNDVENIGSLLQEYYPVRDQYLK